MAIQQEAANHQEDQRQNQLEQQPRGVPVMPGPHSLRQLNQKMPLSIGERHVHDRVVLKVEVDLPGRVPPETKLTEEALHTTQPVPQRPLIASAIQLFGLQCVLTQGALMVGVNETHLFFGLTTKPCDDPEQRYATQRHA
jgi:hypothetical protein